jgi:hypothetical protein
MVRRKEMAKQNFYFFKTATNHFNFTLDSLIIKEDGAKSR